MLTVGKDSAGRGKIARSSAVLSAAALDEFRRALEIYRSVAQTAR